MKSVLIFVDSLSEGGVSKVLLDLLENINRGKYDITVMTLYNQGIFIDEVKKYAKYKYCFNIPNENDKSIRANMYRKFWGGMLTMPEQFMYRWFVNEKYDIEIAFMHGWSTRFISGSNNKNSKKIAWVHTDLVTRSQIDGVFKSIEHHKSSYNKFNKVICVSEGVKSGVESKYNVKCTYVLYNPIDRKKIIQLSKEEVTDLDYSKNFRLVSVGRLSEEKGYDRLLRIVNKLIKEKFNIELILVGNGDKYNELSNYIEKEGLQHKVSLLGYKDNPYKYINVSDLLVCSSFVEGFTLVIGEAMGVGIPVISVECSGTSEWLNCGEYGMLVKNNEQDLYEGIKKMILDKELYKEYKEMAIKRGKMFSITDFISEVENILDNV